MKGIDILLLLAVALILAGAVKLLRYKKKSGRGCCGSACKNNSCSFSDCSCCEDKQCKNHL